MCPETAERDGRDVTARVATIRVRGLAPAARDTDDARESISYMVKELAPWELRFDFLVYADDERPGEREYQLAGFALERPITTSEANTSPDTTRMTKHCARRLLALVPTHRRASTSFQNDRANERYASLSGDRPHRDLQLLVDEYRFRERVGVQDLGYGRCPRVQQADDLAGASRRPPRRIDLRVRDRDQARRAGMTEPRSARSRRRRP